MHQAIIQELVARYGSVPTAPGSDIVNSITYILDRLAGWLSQKQLAGNEDAYVFLDALEAHSEELFALLRSLGKKP